MLQLDDRDRAVLETYRRPRSQSWGVGRPALLVVDVVESFVGRDVPVHEAQQDSRQACGEHAWRALPAIAGLLEGFRARDLPVAFTTISDALEKGPRPGGTPAAPPRNGALRSDRVVDPIAPLADELVLPKVRPSAFFGTPLITWLQIQRADTVVVVGGATSGCVRATAVDAHAYGLDVLLPTDGCFDRVVAVHEASIADLDLKYARAVTSAEVLSRLPEGAGQVA